MDATDQVYANVTGANPVSPKPAAKNSGPRTPDRRVHRGVIVCLVMLSVLLLTAIALFAVYVNVSEMERSALQRNLTTELDDVKQKLSFVKAELDDVRQQYFTGGNIPHTSTYWVSSTCGDWESAKSDCEGQDAQLMIIKSEDELTNLPKSLFSDASADFWIGLKYNNVWTWIDDTPVNDGIWKKCKKGKGEDTDKGCAVIKKINNDFCWKGKPCSQERKWICEY